MRGPRRHFTHSRVLAWVFFDRTATLLSRRRTVAKSVVQHLRQVRDEIHADVCANGLDSQRGVFTQYYGGRDLDAALLLIPALGFLPGDDKRVIATVEAVQRELFTPEGLVHRYPTHDRDDMNVDGLRGHEGAFLPCSFWLADALTAIGRTDEAANSSTGSSCCPTTWDCSPRSTHRQKTANSATSHRASASWPSRTPAWPRPRPPRCPPSAPAPLATTSPIGCHQHSQVRRRSGGQHGDQHHRRRARLGRRPWSSSSSPSGTWGFPSADTTPRRRRTGCGRRPPDRRSQRIVRSPVTTPTSTVIAPPGPAVGSSSHITGSIVGISVRLTAAETACSCGRCGGGRHGLPAAAGGRSGAGTEQRDHRHAPASS
ncbi:glycoside hydrolase family 15 protein [Streptomyces sp. CBMA123]|uniref:glycoside hydrolase family 15 protein n=1 Tax=Streptomyces sp. CBMA123 TaxID=1896313 RepID=UPI00294FF8FE|nr:glycoside hydrolase family 15 protein [Streptomyces sp. CBMA123]